MDAFNQEHLTPYLDFHRPCFFPAIRTDPKGKERTVSHDETMMTPDEKLNALPKAEDYLKPGITFEILEATAHRFSDNHAAALLLESPSAIIHHNSGTDSEHRGRDSTDLEFRLIFTDWKILGI